MSWIDKSSVKTILEIRDAFQVKTFIETGTYKGTNAKFHSKNFERVVTIEKDQELYLQASKKLAPYPNITCLYGESSKLLASLRGPEYTIYYLDAHFYDPNLPAGKGKFTILQELKALQGNTKALIVIHDFDNGLGHITYDGIPLDLELLREPLKMVNPNFRFFTNELATCDMRTADDVGKDGIDEDARENIEYAHSHPRLLYRGILYAVPGKLDMKELK